jgi:hypothetical protein
MHYWWGLGIGHTYSHTSTPQPVENTRGLELKGDADGVNFNVGECVDQGERDRQAEDSNNQTQVEVSNNQKVPPADDDPELGMDERENEDLGERYDLGGDDAGSEDEPDDETFLAIEEMYGSQALA